MLTFKDCRLNRTSQGENAGVDQFCYDPTVARGRLTSGWLFGIASDRSATVAEDGLAEKQGLILLKSAAIQCSGSLVFRAMGGARFPAPHLLCQNSHKKPTASYSWHPHADCTWHASDGRTAWRLKLWWITSTNSSRVAKQRQPLWRQASLWLVTGSGVQKVALFDLFRKTSSAPR